MISADQQADLLNTQTETRLKYTYRHKAKSQRVFNGLIEAAKK